MYNIKYYILVINIIFILILPGESLSIANKITTSPNFIVYPIEKSNSINSTINNKRCNSTGMAKITSSKLSNFNGNVTFKRLNPSIINAHIANDFKLDSSIKTILLSGIYGIRIFKCMLYLRYILEWLPQVNPYLPPFCVLYNATNNFIKFFQKICPQIMGFDFSGFLAWVFLENLEFVLLHILSNY